MALDRSHAVARVVPLEIRSVGEGVAFDPPRFASVALELRSSKRELDTLPAEAVAAYVELSGATPGLRVFRVQTNAPPGIEVVNTSPSFIQMLLRPRGGPVPREPPPTAPVPATPLRGPRAGFAAPLTRSRRLVPPMIRCDSVTAACGTARGSGRKRSGDAGVGKRGHARRASERGQRDREIPGAGPRSCIWCGSGSRWRFFTGCSISRIRPRASRCARSPLTCAGSRGCRLRSSASSMAVARAHGDLIDGRFSMRIVLDCAALDAHALLAAAVLTFPARWRQRIAGVVAGALVVAAVNIARIGVLYFVGVRWPSAFPVLHEEVLQIAIILATFSVFGGWIAIVRRAEPRARGSVPVRCRAMSWTVRSAAVSLSVFLALLVAGAWPGRPSSAASARSIARWRTWCWRRRTFGQGRPRAAGSAVAHRAPPHRQRDRRPGDRWR